MKKEDGKNLKLNNYFYLLLLLFNLTKILVIILNLEFYYFPYLNNFIN